MMHSLHCTYQVHVYRNRCLFISNLINCFLRGIFKGFCSSIKVKLSFFICVCFHNILFCPLFFCTRNFTDPLTTKRSYVDIHVLINTITYINYITHKINVYLGSSHISSPVTTSLRKRNRKTLLLFSLLFPFVQH